MNEQEAEETAYFPEKGEVLKGTCPECGSKELKWTGNDDEMLCRSCGHVFPACGYAKIGKTGKGGENVNEQEAEEQGTKKRSVVLHNDSNINPYEVIDGIEKWCDKAQAEMAMARSACHTLRAWLKDATKEG